MARESHARRVSALVILAVTGCGARSGLAEIAEAEDGGAEFDGFPSVDSASFDTFFEPDVRREADTEAEADVDPGPKSCDDVGKYPGTATCCKDRYCEGYCRNKGTPEEVCDCGVIGGCAWPVICCRGTRCVGPALCSE